MVVTHSPTDRSPNVLLRVQIRCSDWQVDQLQARMCGEYVDDIAATGVHGFVLEPLTDLEYIVRRYGHTHVIIGNADTRILLSGSKDQIRAK